MNSVAALWVYLAASPLLWLTLTLIAYGLAVRVYAAVGMRPIANPLLTATALVILALVVTATPYETYFEGAQFIHFLLGPTTVALAIPLIDNLDRVRRLRACCIATLSSAKRWVQDRRGIPAKGYP